MPVRLLAFDVAEAAVGLVSELGVPLDLPNLPSAWRAAVARCPYCVGLGTVERDGVGEDCVHCEGSGDLMATLLYAAFLRGRGQLVHHMREIEKVRRLAGERIKAEEPSAAELKRAMGLW